MAKILIIEDDPSIREPLQEFLKSQGLQVSATDRIALAKDLVKDHVDLIILDWNLPDGNGPDLAKEIAKSHSQIPIIMLTARTDITDRVMALELGANDYVIKPFDQRELLARIRVQLRKANSTTDAQILKLGDVSIDATNWEVKFKDKKIEFTRKEFELLKILAENPNRVFTRDELLTKIWGMDDYESTRTVDTHILNLRNKLAPELFETVRGVGYRFKWKP